MTKLRVAVPLLLIAALWAWGFPALDQYNVTWDEALGDLFFGERYLSYFTSFDPVYLDFQSNPYPPERRPDLFVSPFKIRPWEYYPVANTLAAATSAVLARALGWLDAFDGFHAVNLLLGAVLLWSYYRLLAERWGHAAALAAASLLFGSPRVVCHMMANVKDFPLMVFYALTAVAFLRAFEAGSAKGLLGAGALLGLSLGTKGNALFFPAVPLLVLAFGGVPEAWRGRRRQLLLALVGGGLVAVAVMVAVWPYLWPDPVGRFTEHLRYIGLRVGYTRAESVAPALQAVALTTPPAFLAFFAAGLVPCLRRAFHKASRDRLALMMLAWIAVVLGRFFVPQAVNFDGVRHFLELFPALAAVAGLGVAALLGAAARRLPALATRPARALLVGLALLPGAWAVLRTHPFQIAYWNVFAGGPRGAYERGLPQAGDYWGMSYRLGFEWLNANAPPGALLAVPVVEHAVRLVAPLRLREDIVLLPVTNPFTPRIAPDRLRLTREAARDQPLFVMFVVRRDWMNELMAECLTRLEPAAAWQLDGAPVLVIYRYRPPDGTIR
ncbi:MAG TPA: glycosyltransferase family 39 protein [Thermoanaerobaculia bacterium]|jgi:4-amino-4-deoxy-L-arabinose transferase-like glycosyltransferase